MLRLQVFWLLLGVVAFMSVRRQKRVSASLFDQRKLAAEAAHARRQLNNNGKRRSSDAITGGVELTPLGEEGVSLTTAVTPVTANDRLEVV